MMLFSPSPPLGDAAFDVPAMLIEAGEIASLVHAAAARVIPPVMSRPAMVPLKRNCFVQPVSQPCQRTGNVGGPTVMQYAPGLVAMIVAFGLMPYALAVVTVVLCGSRRK